MVSGTSLSCKQHKENKILFIRDYSRGQLPATLSLDFRSKALAGQCPAK